VSDHERLLREEVEHFERWVEAVAMLMAETDLERALALANRAAELQPRALRAVQTRLALRAIDARRADLEWRPFRVLDALGTKA
jgi:hypothetical protein